MLLLSMLTACNPEHNQGDLARIDTLETTNAGLTMDLEAARSQADMLQGQATTQAEALEAFITIARAYQATAKMSGDELVVCQPTDIIVDGEVTLTLPLPRTQPWVQASVTPDCGEPKIVHLIVPDPAPAPTIANADGPELANAPGGRQ